MGKIGYIIRCGEDRVRIEEKLKRWRDRLGNQGLKISISKTKYMATMSEENSNGDEVITLGQEPLESNT